MFPREPTYFTSRSLNGAFSSNETSSTIELHLRYDDRQQDLKFQKTLTFLSTDSISHVIQEFLRASNRNRILPENVSLVGVGVDEQLLSPCSTFSDATLEELNVRNGCFLLFEPRSSLSSRPSRPYSLTIYGPDLTTKATYEWEKATTTLSMLLDYIIKAFSLGLIDRQRVHLFKELTELDLVSSPDKLLSELGFKDFSYVDVEITPARPLPDMSLYSGPSPSRLLSRHEVEGTHDGSATDADPFIELDLRYHDYGRAKEASLKRKFLPTNTLFEVVTEFLQLTDLKHLAPRDLCLVRLQLNHHSFYRPSLNMHKTLHELQVHDGHVLYFEPDSSVSSRRTPALVIYGPRNNEFDLWKWSRDTTTLKMLLDHVIETFSLEQIPTDQIHLLTASNDELDIASHGHKLLSEIGVTDGMRIHVQTVSPRPSSMVHVECDHTDGKYVLEVPSTIQIHELLTVIGEQFRGHVVTNLTARDHRNRKLDFTESDQTLLDLGIEHGETIYVKFTVTPSDSAASRTDTREAATSTASSIIADRQRGTALVRVRLSQSEDQRFEVSLSDTVGDLINDLQARNRSRPFGKFHMSCRSIVVDAKQLHRRLADIGIESGDEIEAVAVDSNPVSSSIYSSRATTSGGSDKAVEWNRISCRPVGLSNLGNTCYMNGALQCLAHTRPLTSFFLDGLSQNVAQDDAGVASESNLFDSVGPVTGAYADLLRNVWLPSRQFSVCYSFQPTRLREIVGIRSPNFNSFDQQDAQEFLTFLLNEMHREFKGKGDDRSNTIIEDLFFGRIQSTMTCLQCKHQQTTKTPISFLPLPITEPRLKFRVKYVSRYGDQTWNWVTVPEGGQVKHLIEAFMAANPSRIFLYTIVALGDDGQVDSEMQLDRLTTRDVVLVEQDELSRTYRYSTLNWRTRRLTLDDCLREFCSVEQLDESWSCPQEECKAKTKATKQLQLYELPPILVIQLKRFSHENGLRRKLETFVEYPIDALDLTSFLPHSGQQHIYDLFAVCKHSGSISGGHYVACIRRETNGQWQWHTFDDLYVSSSYFNSDIVSSDAYLLFYERR